MTGERFGEKVVKLGACIGISDMYLEGGGFNKVKTFIVVKSRKEDSSYHGCGLWGLSMLPRQLPNGMVTYLVSENGTVDCALLISPWSGQKPQTFGTIIAPK